MAIYETHVQFSRLSSFWTNNGYTPIHIIEANGHSGGIWLLKQATVNITTTVFDSNPHSVSFSISRGSAITNCTCIYASPNPSLRPTLWSHLVNINHIIDGPWMLIGDFNETLLPSDQRGGVYHHNRAASFSNFMTACNLLDLTTTGGRFTWHKNNNGIRILSKKLDRGLANIDWRIAFPEAFVEVLCRLHSDHNPLLLRFGGLPLSRGPRPFRFEAAWIDHKDYEELVKNSWRHSHHNISTALNKFKENSTTFNFEIFGNIFQRKKHIEKRLKGIQNYLERVDSRRHSILEKELQQEYNHILHQEEMLWYQKSREKWIKFGDKNNAFFHAQTIIRRKKNRVHRLQLPCGTWSYDSDTLQEEAQNYFKAFFSGIEPNHDRNFNEGIHPTIDDDGKLSLLSPITKKEVFTALNSMKPYKAPGPDGFHYIFFKQSWHIVGDDIYQMEIIHFMRRSKKKKGFVAFKIDLEKAFDKVNWEFLRSCLHDFGFPDITIRLIMHCVSSSNYSILWNGNKLPYFKPTRGLRQGDPLSPYLFILCMEKLSIAINSAVNQGSWEPVQITNTGPQISHLLFADDVLIFTKANTSQFHFIQNLFERFSRASSLKINISKSRAFYSSGVPQAWKNRLLNRIGRVTLATSVLSSIPTYYMQINWLPQSICDSIDQTTRNFIWKGANNTGIHLVNWKTITSEKQNGGLGIRTAREANTSLLGKLVWDLVQATNKLWVHTLSNKYVSGPNTLHATINSSSSPTWSSIIKAKNVLQSGYCWRPGSGSSSFWFDTWSSHGFIGSHVSIIDIHDIHLTVHEVFSYNGQHTHALCTNLPQAIADSINNTHMKFNDRV
ncbi:uncharacterized protein [Medicago truncatula]|uniref:uncharacterized protein n=1 Tax=Medicago truncatula TaxID=3880 RepID=UPI0019678765|nr:uncharacterized protein LOC120577470 [Medicago truncatula]